MLRGARLTWRMHRFEVVMALALVALVAISAAIVASRIAGLGVSPDCWPRTENGNHATGACDSAMAFFWSMEDTEGGIVRVTLGLIGPILGLLLGVPIVARELELRTTSLAWSLEGRRWRWLLARMLPMLAVALVASGLVAAAGSAMFDAFRLGNEWPHLHELASSGVALVGRAVLAFGIALLVGAVLGRTMPALVVATGLVVAWAVVAIPLVQMPVHQAFAVWQQEDPNAWKFWGPGELVWLDGGNFDTSVTGVGGLPGARYEGDTTSAEVEEECGLQPVWYEDDSVDPDSSPPPELTAWEACADPIWRAAYARLTDWTKAVPGERFGDYVALDVAVSLLVGGAAILLTFPVVTRRRPT
jgi:hypothetical protein